MKTGNDGRIGRRPSPWILAACLWVGFVACSAREDTTEPHDEIVIGVIAPVASNFLISGPPTVEGALLAAKEINAGGGVAMGNRRRALRLIVEDNEGRPETAVSKAFKLIGGDRAVALVGIPNSDSALAVARVAEEQLVPMISTTSTNPETTRGKRFVFRMIFHDSRQGQVLAELAYQDLGARNAAIVFDPGSAYSRGLAQEFRRIFEQEGGEVSTHVGFTADVGDASDLLLRIDRAGADVLFLPMYSALLRSLMPQVKEIGIEAPVLGGDAWGSLTVAERSGWGPSFFTDVWTPEEPDDLSRHFIESYHHAYGKAPTSIAALAYDAVFLVVRAIELQGDAAPRSIREGLSASRGFSGVTGAIRFEETGDPMRTVVIMKLATDGTAHLYRRVEP